VKFSTGKFISEIKMYAVANYYFAAAFIILVIVVVVIGVVVGTSQSPPALIIEPTTALSSPATGLRKALLIGCDYPRTAYQLNGCINDTRNIETLLRSNGYADIEMLCDDGSTLSLPTMPNIISKLTSAVGGMSSGDVLFVWYSGHGAQLSNPTSDGGYDECWCPPDTIQTGRYLRDNVLNSIVKSAPFGANIFIGSDSCHSATIVDLGYMIQQLDGQNKNRLLKYNEEVRGRIKLKPRFLQPIPERFVTSQRALARGAERGSARANIDERLHQQQTIDNKTMVVIRDNQLSISKANVFTLSGCQDFSVSVETCENGENQGAMTWAFLRNFNTDKTLSTLLADMRSDLKTTGYPQIPQLAMGTAIDPNITTLGNII
jgi:hypothetical protein